MLIEELSNLIQQPLNPNREENSVRCPLHDDNRPSMSINLRKGVWNCQGCGKAGTLRTLAQFLGSDLDKGDLAALTANTLPDPEPVDFIEHLNAFAPVKITTPEAQKYMKDKGIRFETLTKFGVRHDGRGNLVMPYFDGDRVVALKYRAKDGFKWFESGSERTIYNLNGVRGVATVVLAEGESDTHVLHQSLPGVGVGGIPGANSSVSQWETWSLDLMFAKQVWIAFDADDAGDKGAERAMETIGACARRLRPLGNKDWSDAIAAGEKPVLV